MIIKEDVVIEQMPAKLHIRVYHHDDLSILFTFGIPLTDYTFEAAVDDQIDDEFTVIDTDLAAGKITLSGARTFLSELKLGDHQWYLDWITPAPASLRRRILAGKLTTTE